MPVSFRRRRRRRQPSSVMLFMASAALLLSMAGSGLVAVQDIAAQDASTTVAKAIQDGVPPLAFAQDGGETDPFTPTPTVTPTPTAISHTPTPTAIPPTPTPTVMPPTPTPTSEPQGPVGTEPDVVGVAAESGPVRLSKYHCAADVAPSDQAYLLGEQCTEDAAPVELTITGEGYAHTLTASAGVPQQATFDDVPYGIIDISEAVPPGHGDPLLFCSDTATDGPGLYEPVPLSGATGSWDHRSDASASLRCLFFNFALDEAEGRDIHVTKYTCAPGYTPLGDDYLMSEQCLEDIAPVEFTISAPGGWSQTQPANPGVPQGTTFGNVPFGAIEITESVPPGFGTPTVFCTDIPADGPGAYEPVPVTGGDTVALEHRAEAEIDLGCIFFNFALDGDEDGNQLTVTKFACPPGTDPMLGLPDLGTTCEIMPGVTFELNGGAARLTDLSGTTSWAGIPAAPWTVSEEIPTGYGPDPVVFCGPIHETEAPRVTAVDGAFSGEFLETGIHLVCTVFNFQDEDPGEGRDVHFHKYTCPPEIERTSDWWALGESCFEEIDPVQVTVTVPGAGYSDTRTMDASVPQTATFDDVPFGTLYLEEAVPNGFGHPMVFCTDTPADGMGNYTEVDPWPESGAFIWEHRADAEIDLTCIIFNFHDGVDNTVTVNKYVCPPGVNAETDDLLSECSPGGDGIGFEFVDGNGSHPAAVSGGMVEWAGVVIGAEGELQIIETIPPGYGEPWVVCDGILMASTGGFVIPNLGEERPFQIVCDWFNFAQADSTLIVVKHECPPGYDPNAPAADPEADCATLIDGVDFHLAGPGTDVTSTTGDAGTGMVQFTGLAPGNYVVTETMPDGTASSFVSTCVGNVVGSVRPFPLSTGDTLNLTVHAGEEIVCHWFNVPGQDDTSLTVIKYTCATQTFVSEVDCEIEESGVSFDLVWWNGDAWEWSATGTTDAAGRVTFGPLDPGEYWLDEHGAEWCHLSSAAISDDGNWLNVHDDEQTVGKVYNCDGTPGKPGETPTKYPNTGVPPAGEGTTSLPMAGAMIGLLGATLNWRRLGALAFSLPAPGVELYGAAQDQAPEPQEDRS